MKITKVTGQNNCQSTLDLDTKIDIENTNPNIDQKLCDSSMNIIFQSPVPKEDYFKSNRVRDSIIGSKEYKKKENSGRRKSMKRSFSKGGSRSSQIINPLTDSYECQNIQLDRYYSEKNL